MIKYQYAYQRSTKLVVDANIITKGDGPFECIDCAGEMIARKGEQRSHHFAHKGEYVKECHISSEESLEHKYAKQLLHDHLDKWTLIDFCMTCATPINSHKFRDHHTCKIEYNFDKFKVDVMVFNAQGKDFAALEVKHSHAVTNEKRIFFQGEGVPIFEVDAKDIINRFNDKNLFVGLSNSMRNCFQCENKKKYKHQRPCLGCNAWKPEHTLTKIIANPMQSGYKYSYICQKCLDNCPKCNKLITKSEKINNKGVCEECEFAERQKDRRKCIDCSHWFDKKQGLYIAPPPNYPYPRGWICAPCYKLRDEVKKE